MALPRESTFLPSIKCSVCGHQVEISKMGDHLCIGPTAELSPPLDANEKFDDQLTNSSYPKSRRTPPPVETGHSYMHRGQLTPVSEPSVSRDTSPVYPARSTSPRGTEESSRLGQSVDDSWETSKSATFPRKPESLGPFDEAKNGNSAKPLGGGFMDRINTVIPGPFDSVRRPSTDTNSHPQRKDSLEAWVPPSDEPLPPRHPHKDGYEGFGAPSSLESTGPAILSRSETYPKPSITNGHFQAHGIRSGIGPRLDRSATGGDYGHGRKKSMLPDTSRRPPPRTSLLPENRLRNTASVNLAAEFGVANPYHTPSDSASSGYSDSSVESRTTAQTSPARSQTHQAEQDQKKNETALSRERLKPEDLRIDPVAAASHQYSSRMVESPYGISPREIQFDRSSPNSQRGPPSRGGVSPSPQEDSNYIPTRFNQDTKGGEPVTLRKETARERQVSRDPIPLPSRGDCKACGIAIRGKSISSADGRLTGKYHKACFVCTTCTAPFSSSVFYVLDDKPYCDQHYHKLNNSLCGGCGRGIEGQYVENEVRAKYHMNCFRCLDCGVSLSDGYFEVDGYSYCERDAWRRVQPQHQPHVQPDPRYYQRGSPRGMMGARPPYGLPPRPTPRPGPGGRPYPGSAGFAHGGGLGAGMDPRFKMNKRSTRLGNMNM